MGDDEEGGRVSTNTEYKPLLLILYVIAACTLFAFGLAYYIDHTYYAF